MGLLHQPSSENFQIDFSLIETPESFSMRFHDNTSVDATFTTTSTEPESSQRRPAVSGQEKAEQRREQIRRAGQRHRQAKAKYLDYLEKSFMSQKIEITTANTELSSLRWEVKCLRAALARGMFSGFASNYYGEMGQKEGLKLCVTVLVENSKDDSSLPETGGQPLRCSSDGTQYSTSVGSSFETTPKDLSEDTLVDMDALLEDRFFPDEPPRMHFWARWNCNGTTTVSVRNWVGRSLNVSLTS